MVEWAPLNGLIDINSAPEPLLAAMFQHMGELPAAAAESLAKQAVEARSRKDPQGQKEGFDAPEDLLRVPGIDYPLYARIAPFVTSSLSGSGLVNPQAAPVSVLTVLAQGNATLAQQFASARGSTPQAMDTTRLTSAFLDPNSSSSLRIMANVQGGTVQKTWWVSLTPSDRSGLPWQFMGQRVTTDTP